MTRNSLFNEYVRQDDAVISPAVGALLFARHEYPDLDVDLYLGRLDAYGRSAARRIEGLRDPYQVVRALNRLCFEDECLRGDTRTYDDPRNCFMNHVLDRLQGIPITLSVIYLEVGARCRLPLRGVGFPGHFLVRYDHPEATLFLDPFHAGRILTREDLRALLSRHAGCDADVQDGHLAPVGPKAILARMLGNLKRRYLAAGALEKVLWVTGCRIALDPASVSDFRDRGVAALQLNRYPEALHDLARSAALAPDDPETQRLLETVRDLRRLVPLLN